MTNKTIFLTATGAGTWTVPSDWSNVNTIIAIGAGGSGGTSVENSFGAGTGGGGGAFSSIVNLSTLNPGDMVSYTVGAGGAAVTRSSIGNTPGNAGGDTWFNGASLAASSVGAKGGGAGQASGTANATVPGGQGAQASAGVGTVKQNGGSGGNQAALTNVRQHGTGGGGAGGPNADGVAGVNLGNGDNSSLGSAGGAGDGGNADAGAGGPSAGPGGAGNAWTQTSDSAVAGPGGGGGGAGGAITGVLIAGSGGLYGAGGGGVCNDGGAGVRATSGAGTQGIIVIIYTPGTPPPPPPTPEGTNTYYIERMDNRVWPTAENCWCVDCGFTLPQPTPDAIISVNSAVGAGIPTGVTNLIGGQNYSAGTIAQIVDDDGDGPGVGAVASLTIVNGVITAVAITGGIGYLFPALVINDPANTGSGASATVVLDNSAIFVTSAPIFASTDVGKVIRCGYGVATITAFNSTQQVTAQITSPITQVQTDDPLSAGPLTFASGTWTMTAPITAFYVPQLVGFEITGLADGNVIRPTVVPANGLVTLSQPASAVIVGLGFQVQLQSTYLDAGEPTVQGQRKKIAEVTARVEASSAFQAGTNQPDGSVQNPPALFEPWQNLDAVPTHAVAPYNSNFTPLYTGDIRLPVQGGFNTRGQVAVQQLNPQPLQVLAFVPEILGGDEPSQKAPPRQQQRGNGGR